MLAEERTWAAQRKEATYSSKDLPLSLSLLPHPQSALLRGLQAQTWAQANLITKLSIGS